MAYRKRPPPSPRTPLINVPPKKKRLEELFNEDSHDTKQELSVLCTSTTDDNLTAETKDTACLKDSIAESESLSGESLKMQLSESQNEIVQLREELSNLKERLENSEPQLKLSTSARRIQN